MKKEDPVNTAWSFRQRGTIGLFLLLPVIILWVFSKPLIAGTGLADVAADFCGWLFLTLYMIFRLWSTVYVGGRKDRELQMQGPYSITRNPLYFGSFCFVLSVAFFCKSLILVLMILVVGYIYSKKVVASEEAFLENMFGDVYRDYKKRVPRFFPNPFLFHSEPRVDIEMRPFEKEIWRLFLAMFMPVFFELLVYLKTLPHWPHWVTLP